MCIEFRAFHAGLSRRAASERGDRVRDVLRKGLPIDLHPAAFPEGSMAISAIEGIRVAVVRNGSHYDLLCPRSFTDSLRHWLLDAALEFTQTDPSNGSTR